jgi:hypothetical protein
MPILAFLNDLELAFNFLKVLDVGVRQVQAAIPGAAGNTKLNIVLGTVEGAIGAAQTAEVNYAAIAPALTGAVNAMVAGYKAVGDPAFVTPAQAAAAPTVKVT